MGETFKLFETRNPSMPGLSVDVEMKELLPSDIPAQHTALSACAEVIRRRIPSAWHTYEFVKVTDGPPGFCSFKFLAPQTAAERAVPFQTFTTYKEHAWPAVLFAFNAFPDYSNPRQSGTIVKSDSVYAMEEIILPTWVWRRAWIEQVVADSKCIVERFSGMGVAFTDEELDHIQPVPAPVEWDYNGKPDGMVCLHPELKIPSHGNSARALVDGAPTIIGSTSGFQPFRLFPATNFEEWAPFVLSDSQVEENGEWYRERVTIYPPPQPEIIFQ